jgi:hypothetical protein
MNRMFVLVVIIGCLAIFTAQAASAAEQEIYIRNRLFNGDVMWKNKEIYIPLDDFTKLAKLTLHQKGGACCLTDPAKGDEKCCLNEEATGLYVNGQKFEGILTGKEGRLFVPLKKIAESLGAVYAQNSSTGIIDVTFPKKGVTLQDIKNAESIKVTTKNLTLVYYYFDG